MTTITQGMAPAAVLSRPEPGQLPMATGRLLVKTKAAITLITVIFFEQRST
jgi:hypothetical protein